jgi:hypothetical protein
MTQGRQRMNEEASLSFFFLLPCLTMTTPHTHTTCSFLPFPTFTVSFNPQGHI